MSLRVQVINFFLVIRNPLTGGMIYDHDAIVRTYLRGSFALDLVSSIPFDLLMLAFGNRASALRILRRCPSHCDALPTQRPLLFSAS
jgi:hypothetical protein